MTVLEIIQRSTAFLAKRGVDSPRLQAELLLAEALAVPRLELYLNYGRVLTEPELERTRQWVKRRGHREPLQHILGTASFCGLELRLTPEVFIPRPETELLAERAWQFLKTRSGMAPGPAVLDFGTGSGCIAIALAVHCPWAMIHAIDVSAAAIAVAQANAACHQVTDSIHFHVGDGFSALPAGLQFDLVVANPPYIPTPQIAQLQPEVRDYDPRLALDGGRDGLDFYRRLAAETAAFLRPAGRLLMEFGDGQAEPIRELFNRGPWTTEGIERDYSGRPRILMAACQART